MRISTIVLAFVVVSFGCSSPPPPARNRACVAAKMLGLENPEYEELVTGWGFTADTCLVQSAKIVDGKRVAQQVVWCAVGTGEPVCKQEFGPPAAASTALPSPKKE